MPRKHIIFVHGRSIKPSASRKKKLINDALMHGLCKVSPDAVKAIRPGTVKCSFAYYGDINNAIMATHDPDIAARLTARNNKAYQYEPCMPHEPYAKSLRQMLDIGTFDEAAYNQVVSQYKDLRYLDNAARAFSTLLSVLTRSHANEIILQRSSADMGAYLTSRKTGSDVREHAGGRFPKAIVKDWVNIAAYDDFIAHDPTMADDFAEMLEYGYVDQITDKRMYNCWVHYNTSNPHKLYGYLANELVATEIADWVNR